MYKWINLLVVGAVVVGLSAACGTANSNQSPVAEAASVTASDTITSEEMPTAEPAPAPSDTMSEEAQASDGGQSQEQELTKMRISLLERALGAKSAEQAVKTLAEARRTRNGAMEYAVLDPTTREQQRKTFEELNWVTGVSSPWIARYRIGKGVKQDDGSVRYPVQFDYRTSTDADREVDWSKIKPTYVTVRKDEEFWYVTKVV
ncbi:hypothetical protein [Cohnella yongneupensis]|uniref:Lipoprotein n=1 Tax=Cohnella yongneupensis TaxID=425006 RepID=A0ABW0QY35_9BACL